MTAVIFLSGSKAQTEACSLPSSVRSDSARQSYHCLTALAQACTYRISARRWRNRARQPQCLTPGENSTEVVA